MEQTTKNDVHSKIVRETFRRGIKDEDAFLVFVLLHSHRILLVENALADCLACSVSAHTQRGVAQALASIWNGTDDQRAEYTYWYYRWNGDWRGYAHAENLTESEQARLAELKQILERHPLVVGFEPEDE